MMIQPYKCVVVANGAFPQSSKVMTLLHQASVIIACDGAAATLLQQGILPTAILGDLDSIPADLKEQYADRIHQVINQEINDLTKAILFAKEQGEEEVLILGATGMREDHTLGNIALLMEHAPLFKRIEMVSDYGWFTPLLQSSRLDSFPGQQVSIFSLSPEGEISTEGLRWPIHNRKLTAWWQGTLNEALGQSFQIALSPQARILIYRTPWEQEEDKGRKGLDNVS